MSESQRFLLEDSSSSDDFDIDELILGDDVEQAMVIVAVKNLQDWMATKRQRGSIVGHITVPQNRVVGHEALMQYYFAEVPTYPPSLFRIRYRMRRELFVKIVPPTMKLGSLDAILFCRGTSLAGGIVLAH
jgi:hypothetical protein